MSIAGTSDRADSPARLTGAPSGCWQMFRSLDVGGVWVSEECRECLPSQVPDGALAVAAQETVGLLHASGQIMHRSSSRNGAAVSFWCSDAGLSVIPHDNLGPDCLLCHSYSGSGLTTKLRRGCFQSLPRHACCREGGASKSTQSWCQTSVHA